MNFNIFKSIQRIGGAYMEKMKNTYYLKIIKATLIMLKLSIDLML